MRWAEARAKLEELEARKSLIARLLEAQRIKDRQVRESVITALLADGNIPLLDGTKEPGGIAPALPKRELPRLPRSPKPLPSPDQPPQLSS